MMSIRMGFELGTGLETLASMEEFEPCGSTWYLGFWKEGHGLTTLDA